MAHIPDGVLSFPVLAAGGALAAAGVGLGLRALDERQIPRVAILSAAFFALSLVAIPIGPSSIHLLLGGLMGLMLGPPVFVAVFAALLLQAAMFGFGGLTTLGVNSFNIAAPAAMFGLVFAPAIARAEAGLAGLLAAICSGLAVAATALLVSLSLYVSSPDYAVSATVMAATYVPLLLAEAAIAGFCVSFVKRVKPELLQRNLAEV